MFSKEEAKYMFSLVVTGEKNNIIKVTTNGKEEIIECLDKKEAQARMFELIEKHWQK